MTREITHNPSVFKVTDRYQLPSMMGHSGYKFAAAIIMEHGYAFGSYYIPGSYWEKEVFVCPDCKSATLIEFAKNKRGYFCKYCYSTWVSVHDRLMLEDLLFDEDGKSVGSILT